MKSMTAVEMSTAHTHSWAAYNQPTARSTCYKVLRYLPTMELTPISNIWTHIPAPLLALLLSSANLDSCFAHLPSTCSAKQNIQTELLTTGARKNCVGMTRPQAFWDYFLLSLWLGITKNDNSYKTSRGWIFSNTNSRTYGRLILRYSQFCWIL